MSKSAKSWGTRDKGSGRKDAEGALKFKKEGQMTSVKEVYSKINSAYKYIMYENIKTYKETVLHVIMLVMADLTSTDL